MHLSIFIRLLPDVINHFATTLLGPLHDCIQIFNRERNVLDSISMLDKMCAHHLGLLRVGVIAVFRTKQDLFRPISRNIQVLCLCYWFVITGFQLIGPTWLSNLVKLQVFWVSPEDWELVFIENRELKWLSKDFEIILKK